MHFPVKRKGLPVADQHVYEKLVGVFVSDISRVARGSRDQRLEAIIQAAQRLRGETAQKTKERTAASPAE